MYICGIRAELQRTIWESKLCMVSSFSFIITDTEQDWRGIPSHQISLQYWGSLKAEGCPHGCLGSSDTQRLLVCWHRVTSSSHSSMLLGVGAEWGLDCLVQKQSCLLSDHLTAVTCKSTCSGWVLDQQSFYGLGLNVYFGKNSQGLGLGWAWQAV